MLVANDVLGNDQVVFKRKRKPVVGGEQEDVTDTVAEELFDNIVDINYMSNYIFDVNIELLNLKS